jgi:hypothetical protein
MTMNDSISYTTYLNELVSGRNYVKVQFFTELHELITTDALLTTLTKQGDESVSVLLSGEQIPVFRLVSAGGTTGLTVKPAIVE